MLTTGCLRIKAVFIRNLYSIQRQEPLLSTDEQIHIFLRREWNNITGWLFTGYHAEVLVIHGFQLPTFGILFFR